MPRIVLACVVVIFAITTYRCIMVNADDVVSEPKTALVNDTSNTTKSNTTGTGAGSTAGSKPPFNCASGPTFPTSATQCISNVPDNNITMTMSTCTMVDGSSTICECSAMTYNGTAVSSVSATGNKVYIPLDTCQRLGGPNACDCVASATTNSTGAGGAAAKAKGGSGSASIAAAPALLLGSVLAALLTKTFP